MRWVLPLGLALIALLSACSGGDSGPTTTPAPSASATANASPTASSTATPGPTPTPFGQEMHRGDDAFLGNLSVIVEAGCWGCDGPPSGLFRAYGYQDRGAKMGWLLRTSREGPTITDIHGNVLASGFIRDIVSTPDTSVIAVSVCVQGTCALEGLNGFDPSSITATFRSLDSGITWQEIDRRGPVAGAVGVIADGQVLIANSNDARGTSMEYVLMPAGTNLKPPTPNLRPLVASDEVAWITIDGTQELLRNDGTVIAVLPGPTSSADYPSSLSGTVAGNGKSSAIVAWQVLEDNNDVHHHFILVENGTFTGPPLSTDHIVYLGSWSPKSGKALISIDIQGPHPLPAFLDLQTGEYNVIPNPFDGGPGVDVDTGRTIALGAETGPFALVKGTGSCLNVRAGPGLDQKVETCAADGVLLRDLGDSSLIDGSEWISIMTPSGTLGWASAAFLER